MFKHVSGNARQAGGWLLRGCRYFLHYVREEWRAALLVSACISLLSFAFAWLEAIDGYAFLTIGNVASRFAVAEAKDPSVLVVQIDQTTFVSRFHERSPLDRCTLRNQLAAIYAARPGIVVVDLDLSPAVWIRRESGAEAAQALACEEALYREIQLAASRGIDTVLIDPFPAAEGDVIDDHGQSQWRERMIAGASPGRVRFAHADLPVSYGLTSEHFDDPHSLHAVTRALTGAPPMEISSASAADAAHRSRDRIDTRAYRAELGVILTSWFTDAQLTEALEATLPTKNGARDERKRVVFFGAGYGQDDIFFTPLGELYGVQIHAAAFASSHLLPRAARDLVAMALDVLLGFVFGMFIGPCWRRYFIWSTNASPARRQFASVWILVLVVSLLAALFGLGIASWLTLAWGGIWLSPVPMGLGMLFEGLVSGSLAQAHDRLCESRSLGHRPELPVMTRVSAALWLLIVGTAFLLPFVE